MRKKFPDQIFLEELAKKDPQAVVFEDPQFSSDVLKKIGIEYLDIGQLGYIRLYPEDFIVEELLDDRSLITIDQGGTSDAGDQPEKTFLHCSLVKMGIGTIQATERLENLFALPPKSISYAGIKDAKAVTAQLVSFRQPPDTKKLYQRIDNIFLKDCAWKKGLLSAGDLYGNRFTILVRVKNDFNQAMFKKRFVDLKTKGFPNFYSIQRFGRRLLTHKVGKLILLREYKEAIKLFLTQTSPYESNYVNGQRRAMVEHWGDWLACLEDTKNLPFVFQFERKLLNSLDKTNGDFEKAIKDLADQSKFWVYAYTSYLFNRLLSRLVKEGKIPEKLPLIGNDSVARYYYSELLKQEDIDQINLESPTFLGIKMGARDIETTIIPENTTAYKVRPGIICEFDLPKGVYATTYLSILFDLHYANPVPEWVDKTVVDIKAAIGKGSYEKVRDRLTPKAPETEPVLEIE